MMYYTHTALLQCLIHLQAKMLPPCPCHWPVLPLLAPSECSIELELNIISNTYSPARTPLTCRFIGHENIHRFDIISAFSLGPISLFSPS